MKKNLFSVVMLVVVLFSCSSDDGDNNSSIQINPPQWIRGTWLIDESPIGDNGWRFTSNDVINIGIGGEVSQRGQVQFILDNGGQASADDESTNETYTLTLYLPAGQTVIYSFTKVSDTEITWDSVQNSIYIKQ